MNPRILALAAGLAIGYVLGTRAGRQQYDRLVAGVRSVWDDPRIAAARKDVEDYARQQAPVIRERAEAAAKAAPGVVADVAKDVAERVQTTAKDVAGKVQSTTREVAERAQTVAKDASERIQATAAEVAERVTQAAGDAREQALHVIDDADEPAAR